MVEQAKGGRETARSCFNPDSPTLHKADIIDFINNNYPHATIPTKVKLAELRQIAKGLIASDPSSSELSFEPESPPVLISRRESKEQLLPSTPPKSHKKPTTSLSTSRGRASKKPYTRPSTPAKSARILETSPSPVRRQPPAKSSHCPPTPSKSSLKTVSSTLHKKSVPKNVEKNISVSHDPVITNPIKNKKISAHSRVSSSSHSTRATAKSTSKHNTHKKRASPEAIIKKIVLERSPSPSASESDEVDHSSRISTSSEQTDYSSASNPSQDPSSESNGTTLSSSSAETDLRRGHAASGSTRSSLKKPSKSARFQKAEVQKSKKKKHHTSTSRRVSFAKSPPKFKAVKKSRKPQRNGDPLDDIEKASNSFDFPRVRLDQYGPSANIDMEVSNRSSLNTSHRRKHKYPSLDQGKYSHSVDFNESFFTPASLSYYSDNPYQHRHPTSYNPYPYTDTNKPFSHSDEKHQTDRYNYSPVAFHNAIDSRGANAPSSLPSPWNAQLQAQDLTNNPMQAANRQYSNISYGHTSHTHYTDQPPQQGGQHADMFHRSGAATFSASLRHQPATPYYNQSGSVPPPPTGLPISRDSTIPNGMPPSGYQNPFTNTYAAPAPTPSLNRNQENLQVSFNNPYHQASQAPSTVSRDVQHQPGQSATFPPAQYVPPPPKASAFQSGNFGHASITSSHKLHHQAIQSFSNPCQQDSRSSSFLSPRTSTECAPPKAFSFQSSFLGQTSTTPHQHIGTNPNLKTPTSPSLYTSQNALFQNSTPKLHTPVLQNSDHAVGDHNPNSTSLAFCNKSSEFKFTFPPSSTIPEAPSLRTNPGGFLQSHPSNSPSVRSEPTNEKSIMFINSDQAQSRTSTGARRCDNVSQVIPSISLTSATPPSFPSQHSSSLSKTANVGPSSDYLEVPASKASKRTQCVKEDPKARALPSSYASSHNSATNNKSSSYLTSSTRSVPQSSTPSSQPTTCTAAESPKLGGFSQAQFDMVARGVLTEFLSKEVLNMNKDGERFALGGGFVDLLRAHESNLNSERQRATEELDKPSCTALNPSEETKNNKAEPSVKDSVVLRVSSSQIPQDSQVELPSTQEPAASNHVPDSPVQHVPTPPQLSQNTQVGFPSTKKSEAPAPPHEQESQPSQSAFHMEKPLPCSSVTEITESDLKGGV